MSKRFPALFRGHEPIPSGFRFMSPMVVTGLSCSLRVDPGSEDVGTGQLWNTCVGKNVPAPLEVGCPWITVSSNRGLGGGAIIQYPLFFP